MQSDWYRAFFHGVALELWRRAISPEQTQFEADFLARMFPQGGRLLDVPCGNGRLSLALARRGCHLTGVDIADEFLAEARSAAHAAGLAIDYLHGDMRDLRWKADFDGAFCVGNSFGYLEHAGNLEFLMRVGRALKPGGRFVLETAMAAESLLPNLRERNWYRLGDLSMLIENRYRAAESRLETDYTFLRDGKPETRSGTNAIYTAAELQRMLAGTGLQTVDLYGAFDGKPFQLGSHQLILVTEKPGK